MFDWVIEYRSGDHGRGKGMRHEGPEFVERNCGSLPK